MKLFKRLFLLVLCVMPFVAGAQVATTAGNNLTAWNGGNASASNNNWNSMTNSRTLTAGANAPTADFGNCNSVILRCAQPKCGGCTTLDLARPIVAGCVNSNATCKQYGNDLVEYISAQLVATANTKVQQQQLAAQQAAAAAAAASNSQQMQQMQQQMQQMQYEMQQQNAQQMQQMQAALNEQKQMVANAQAEAAAAQQRLNESSSTGLTMAQQTAVESGVSADVLLREQVGGEILSKIENAEVALKALKESMDSTFRYAGCDTRGNNCSGPNRVKVFKEKALGFIDPYESIVDEMYEALETALAVGVDVSDVIMMLSGSCNKWGKYLCAYADHGRPDYYKYRIKEGGDNEPLNCVGGKSQKSDQTRGVGECTPGMTVPAQDDPRCTLISLIEEDSDALQREWVSSNENDADGFVRVGCATSSLDSISIFGRRSSRKGATMDLDTLERLLAQDAPEYSGTKNRYSNTSSNDYLEKTKYCALSQKGYDALKNAIDRRIMPKDMCVKYDDLERLSNRSRLSAGSTTVCATQTSDPQNTCVLAMYQSGSESGCGVQWDGEMCNVTGGCCLQDGKLVKADKALCEAQTGKTWQNNNCVCMEDYKPVYGHCVYFKNKNCSDSGGVWKGENGPNGYCECKADKNAQNSDGTCIAGLEDIYEVAFGGKLSKNNKLDLTGGVVCQASCAETGGMADLSKNSGACCKCGVVGQNYNPVTQECKGARIVNKSLR